jgi:6,7-dimethyl-8-ribityllumazine synthase
MLGLRDLSISKIFQKLAILLKLIMKKILIISADFYQDISNMLLDGALNEIKKHDFDHEIIKISGALEIPAIVSMAIKSNQYSGFIALGCVIRGKTSHYDHICQEVMRGINKLAIKYHIAIGNSIITCETKDQAVERADINQKNKGGSAAKICFEMISIQRKLNLYQKLYPNSFKS